MSGALELQGAQKTGVGKSKPGAPAIISKRNPADKIGIGLIGCGDRGKQHMTEILNTSDARFSAVCDVFNKRLDYAVNLVKKQNPEVKGYDNYRRLLEDKNVDAIIVATPDHWHSKMTIDGADAGKDVYCQKCFTRTVEEAKAMVQAIKRNKRILQLGHTRRSQAVYHRMKEVYGTGVLGRVSIVNITMFRNSAQGAWDWTIEPEGNPETINWNEFLGSAPQREFDADRYFRWRKYWDYGTGISGDLLSHEWDAVNFVMGLGIPSTCIASGGIYFWKEKREVPDVLNVVYDYPERQLAVTWNSTFSNSASGIDVGTHIYGKNATIHYGRGDAGMEVFLEPASKTNLKFFDEASRGERAQSGAEGKTAKPAVRDEKVPLYTYARGDNLVVTSHFQNFLDCVRSRERTRGNEDTALEEAATAIMSVVAYKEKRMVRWDPVNQRIV